MYQYRLDVRAAERRASKVPGVVSSTADHLEYLTLLSDRLSHALRTPLSISLGVMDDLVRGYSLRPDELKDGKHALERMLAILEELRGFSAPLAKSIETCVVDEVLGALLEKLVGDLGHDGITISGSLELRADRRAIERALLALVRYGRMYRERFPESAAGSATIRGSVTEMRTEDEIVIAFGGKNALALAGDVSLEELLNRDHSLDAVGVLFGGCLFERFDASLRAGWREGAGLILRIGKNG